MAFLKNLDHLRIPFGDIKVATNNFTTIIGEGGYGPVYEGKLILSGNLTRVAVKRLRDRSEQGFKEFLTEINLLSRYKHPNLVTLLGFCHESHENILIYEYAEHGSFDNYLNKANPLTWRQRLHICVDAARGLDYLHNRVGADHRIIHRDVKSGNILLDGNFRAKIADFGLSKIGRTVEATFLITNVGGTPSYVDPVYVDTGVLSKKSDVYSFGVVLFEALCARLCFMDVIGEERNLVRLARRCYKQGKLNVIVDPELKDAQSVKVFSSIAYQCLHLEQEARPSMDVVLHKLEKALELEEAYTFQVTVEALVMQEVLKALELQEFEEDYEFQKVLEATILQEVFKALELEELEKTFELQEFLEALILQEALEVQVQEYEEACDLQVLEEALGLQGLDDVSEMQEILEALKFHKHGEILELEMAHGTTKAKHMMSDTRQRYTNKEEVCRRLSAGILVDNGKVWFSIDENGKNQEMISAMKFMPLDTEECEMISWKRSAHDQTCVFPMVIKISNASEVNMQVKIRTHLLSPNVSYAAYLVCKCDNEDLNDQKVHSLKYKLNNQSRPYISFPSYLYEHKWVMIELFQTNSFRRSVEFEVFLERFYVSSYWGDDKEVLVQGIVFLPIQEFEDEKTKTEEMEMGNPPTSEIGVDWENRLPNDYEIFLDYYKKNMEKNSQDFVVSETTKEEAYTILSKGIYIKWEDDDDDVDDAGCILFWLSKLNGKKCMMLSPELIKDKYNEDKLELSHPNESRFKYELQIQSSRVAKIEFFLLVQLLSANTGYACYLVYNIPLGFDLPVEVEVRRERLVADEFDPCDDYDSHTRSLYLSRSQSPVVFGSDGDVAEGEGTPGTIINKLPIRDLPSKRKDGWLEVMLLKFTTYSDSSSQKNCPDDDDTGTEFYTFNSHYNHGFKFEFRCRDHEFNLIDVPSLTVQGVEFRPI